MAEDAPERPDRPQVVVNPDEVPEIMIGEPFALAGTASDGNNCELLAPSTNIPGCFASLLCECGQPFRVDLLDGDFKACPKCDQRYTHILVVAADDDAEILRHMMRQVFVANGLVDDPHGDVDAGDDDDEPNPGAGDGAGDDE